METAAKEKLFQELYQLDVESEEEESCNASVVLSRSKLSAEITKVKAKSHHRTGHASMRVDQSPCRTVLAPLPKARSTPQGRNGPLDSLPFFSVVPSSVVEDSGITERPALSLMTKIMTKPNGKRKRGQSFETRPESQQVFKGLSFFFIPNDDIAPARKLRIRKAMEFGALWVRQWRDDVTHIVADKHVGYEDILKFLQLSSLPANVILVNDVYPSDCLMYGFLVNPDQGYYKVEGQENAPVVRRSPTPAASSETSLQVKSRNQDVEPQKTPSRTEGSDQGLLGQPPDHKISTVTDQSPSRESPRASSHPRNRLDEAIEEAKAIQDLPLDFDEDDSPNDDQALEESTDESGEDERNVRPKPTKGSPKKSWQDGFACMAKHDGKSKSENPNAKTIEILQRMAYVYDNLQDHWRVTAYRKAITSLKKQDSKITTAKEALALPFIGQRLTHKIEEIFLTSRLRRLENATSDPNSQVLQLFMQIYSVGLKQATGWISQGHRTLTDLTTNASLTKNQIIGIQHFIDFQTRIPREEMDQHDKYIRTFCANLDPKLQFTIGGSYRRGAPTSGDIDFIVTCPDTPLPTLRTILLSTIIPALFTASYLQCSLATTSADTGSKWHGACALPGTTIWRRIDFLFVPWEEMGAALIYFTGNDIFNRSIRLLASKKGMRLNQRGLWRDVIRGRNRERITQGALVESKDEKRIFEILGVPWRRPEERIC